MTPLGTRPASRHARLRSPPYDENVTVDAADPRHRGAVRTRTQWWGFALYAAVAALHVATGIVGPESLEYPTKLLLMPVLALAALWALRGTPRSPLTTRVAVMLVVALTFSWLGDGAAAFFPFLDDELPAMLLCFGLAHLVYIVLFLRYLPRRPIPRWTIVYALWWIVMIAALWPSLGPLALGVAVYGLVLGGTAVAATRGSVVTAVGGAFFLASDTILAVRLFLPEYTPPFSGAWVMITYTIGQGLLAYGVVRLLRRGTR